MSNKEIKTIGNYTLGKTIGEGTFGLVKLGIHQLTQEQVAIKILEKDKIKEQADLERVAREINILKQLRHPNIIQLYEIVETEKSLYLIMEYAKGGELFDHISKNQRLKEFEAAQLLIQILAGVEYLHSQRIMHRDLKPENLLLDENSQLKIADFGLSNTYNQDQLLKTACGSPCYAAPEMIAGKEYGGRQADIWSCGVILYAMICGYLPFEDQSTPALYKKIVNGEYAVPKYMSPLAKDLLDKILNVDPLKRFTIPQIIQHFWIQSNVSNPSLKDGIIIGRDEIEIEEEVLHQLQEYNFKIDYAQQCILRNRHNQVTTTYYLLLKKYLIDKRNKYPKDESRINTNNNTKKDINLNLNLNYNTNTNNSANIANNNSSNSNNFIPNTNTNTTINNNNTNNNNNNNDNNNNNNNNNNNEKQIELKIISESDISEAKGTEIISMKDTTQNVIRESNKIVDQDYSSEISQFHEDPITIQDSNVKENVSLSRQSVVENNKDVCQKEKRIFQKLRQASMSIEKKPETLFPTIQQIREKAQQFKTKALERYEKSPQPQKQVLRHTPLNTSTNSGKRSAVSPHISVKQFEGPFNLNQLVYGDPTAFNRKICNFLQSHEYEITNQRKYDFRIRKDDLALEYQIQQLTEGVYVVKCKHIGGNLEEYEGIFNSIVSIK